VRDRNDDLVIDLLQEILEQAKLTNGRVRGHDVKIAILQVGYALGAFLAGSWFLGWIKPQ
jgi:hypothetical protein